MHKELRDWWSTIALAIERGDLRHGHDFILDGRELVIHFASFHDSYLVHRSTPKRDGLLRRMAVCDHLKNSDAFMEVRRQRIGKLTTHVMVFDMRKLKKDRIAMASQPQCVAEVLVHCKERRALYRCTVEAADEGSVRALVALEFPDGDLLAINPGAGYQTRIFDAVGTFKVK